MKNSILKITVCLCVVLLFINCSKEDNNATENNTTENTVEGYHIKVKIDGVDYLFDRLAVVNASSLKLGIITVNADDGNGNNMAIGIAPEDKDTGATGTYVDEFTGVFIENGQAGVWDSDYRLTRDTRLITITENNDDYIEGTFSFTGHNAVSDTTKEFTEGSFRIRVP